MSPSRMFAITGWYHWYFSGGSRRLHGRLSARPGFFWWEFDPTWYGLWLLERMGIIRDLRGVPDPVRFGTSEPARVGSKPDGSIALVTGSPKKRLYSAVTTKYFSERPQFLQEGLHERLRGREKS